MSLDVKIQFPGGRTVPLSAIERDRVSRAKYLETFHGNSGELACLCRREGIPLGVGRRKVPSLLFYFYPLHRTDPGRHAFGCPHRTIREAKQNDSQHLPVIQQEDGKIRINLRAPLYRGEAAADRSPNQEVESRESPRAATPRGQLLTLLEVLWSQAELNVWRPWFAGKRSYWVVAKRLQESAASVRLKRQDLEPLFYVPSPYRPSDETALREKRDRFFDALKPKQGKTYYGYVLALFREAIAQDGDNIAIKMYNAPFRLWIPKLAWQRAERRWFRGGSATAPSALLARVSRKEGSSNPWLMIEEIAFLQLCDEESYIPVASSFERGLGQKLVLEKRHFRKPLACEYESDDVVPDFVLEDRADRCHLEVLGLMTDEAYRSQVEHKKAHYASIGQPVWWWDTSKQGEAPTLPTANTHSGSKVSEAERRKA